MGLGVGLGVGLWMLVLVVGCWLLVVGLLIFEGALEIAGFSWGVVGAVGVGRVDVCWLRGFDAVGGGW